MTLAAILPVTQSKPTVEDAPIVIGMGEMHVTEKPSAVLSCIGIGSCIAICAYDRVSKITGMVHVVLPSSNCANDNNKAKYADTAVPALVEEMTRMGALRSRISVKIAGGAQMTAAAAIKNVFKTGERNAAEVMASLKRESISLLASDVGGSNGRTVTIYAASGKVTTRTVGSVAREI